MVVPRAGEHCTRMTRAFRADPGGRSSAGAHAIALGRAPRRGITAFFPLRRSTRPTKLPTFRWRRLQPGAAARQHSAVASGTGTAPGDVKGGSGWQGCAGAPRVADWAGVGRTHALPAGAEGGEHVRQSACSHPLILSTNLRQSPRAVRGGSPRLDFELMGIRPAVAGQSAFLSGGVDTAAATADDAGHRRRATSFGSGRSGAYPWGRALREPLLKRRGV